MLQSSHAYLVLIFHLICIEINKLWIERTQEFEWFGYWCHGCCGTSDVWFQGLQSSLLQFRLWVFSSLNEKLKLWFELLIFWRLIPAINKTEDHFMTHHHTTYQFILQILLLFVLGICSLRRGFGGLCLLLLCGHYMGLYGIKYKVMLYVLLQVVDAWSTCARPLYKMPSKINSGQMLGQDSWQRVCVTNTYSPPHTLTVSLCVILSLRTIAKRSQMLGLTSWQRVCGTNIH